MYRCYFIMFICSFLTFLSAQSISDNQNQLSSLIIQASSSEGEDYALINTDTNQNIPVLDLSRQMIAPGTYKLKFQKWGYHKYENQFTIKSGEDKKITFTPVPVNMKFMSKYSRYSKKSTVFLISTLLALGSAGLCKTMGDSEYKKYSDATEADEITKYRNSSETYQIAFFTSTSLGLGSASAWLLSILSKRSAKARIVKEMNTPAP